MRQGVIRREGLQKPQCLRNTDGEYSRQGLLWEPAFNEMMDGKRQASGMFKYPCNVGCSIHILDQTLLNALFALECP